MKFKELTSEDKDYFKKVYYDTSSSWSERMRVLEEFTGKSSRTVGRWVVDLGLKRKDEIDSVDLKKAKSRKFDKNTKRFFITWAQNNTEHHDKFFSNMLKYADELNASVHVIAGRYRNPTSLTSSGKKHDAWAEQVTPYLDAARHDVHKYVSIMSDVKIQPTAVNPMTGLQGLSGINSCVFGSPKVQMTMCPVLEGCKPKMMVTTGSCTVKNYTDSKAGKKGEFHHTLGFVIVEIKDDETFFIRQVTADDEGDFSDLMYDIDWVGEDVEMEFNSLIARRAWIKANFGAKPIEHRGESIITKSNKIEACVLGDIHYGKENQEVMKTTIDFLDAMDPEHVVLHDVFDGDSINHHESKDPFAQFRKEVQGTNSLKDEIEYMLTELGNFSKYRNVVIVRSNHDDFLDRWLKDGDWKKQTTAKNSLQYMEYSQVLLQQYAGTSYTSEVKGIIPHLINQRYPEYITLKRNDSYLVRNWELAQHGDIGSSGSRGSLQQFRKLNTKIIVGHYHSPGRLDGAMAVGTSTDMRIGYNQGASGWLQSHIIIHRNGKAQHINFIDGEFTTLVY